MGIANAFSGGIFFAVCMIHILPDVIKFNSNLIFFLG